MLYLVALFTGIRQSEVIGLTWDCVNFDKGTLRVRRQWIKNRETKKYEFQSLKNDKPRYVSPPLEVLLWLLEEFSRQEKNREIAGPLWGNPENLIFTNEFGRHLVHNTVYKHYKKLVAQIGEPNSRFHDLRHTYAVAGLQSGDDMKTLQENLGHHSAAFTMSTYGHFTENMRRSSSERMQEFINRYVKKEEDKPSE